MTMTSRQMPELFPYVLIAIGGFVGSVLHFWINAVCSTLPGTLIVNTLGSVLMGIFMYELIATGRFGQRTRFLIGIGFLGAFTTFSGLAMIAVDQPPVIAVSYVAATLVLGLLGILTGRTVVGILHRSA